MEEEQTGKVNVHADAHTVADEKSRHKQGVEVGCLDSLVADLADMQRVSGCSSAVSIVAAPRAGTCTRRLEQPTAKRAGVWKQIYGGMFEMLGESVSFSYVLNR